MTHEIRDARFGKIAAKNAEVEQVATGFLFVEGPIWHPREHWLVFSDMPGDHMRRWSAADGVTTFRKPSNKANGNAFDHQGRILTCEHATSRVTRTRPDGGIAVLATHWQGKELNSPNDIIVASDGRAYFTDPTYGRFAFYGVQREPELSFRGVYRLEPESRTLELLADDFGQPNGLCLSPDERRLFVNDTERGHIRALDLTADGRVSGSRVWATLEGSSPGGADGMKIDSAGNLFCTGPGGIHVFDAEGRCLGVILVPEVVANLTWGDADLLTLYMTASTSLYRVRVLVPGRPAF
jgi:gluconolactonase